jgi:hypothetical protein
MRKAIITLFAIAVVGLVLPSVASARGGGSHGGGSHGGGFHGGGGRFHGGGFRGFGFGGYYGGYGYGYGYGYPYGYGGYDAGDGGCYLVRQRVMTQYGWRVRRVQVCG